jgi:hypothetical protein
MASKNKNYTTQAGAIYFFFKKPNSEGLGLLPHGSFPLVAGYSVHCQRLPWGMTD